MLVRPIHAIAYSGSLFSLLYFIPLCEQTALYLIHSTDVRHLGSSQFEAIMSSTAVVGIFLGVEVPGHRVGI